MKLSQSSKWSTPMVIGAGVFVAITGIMMFYHILDGAVKSAHEWVGLIFAIGILFHIINHWRGFKTYFSQKMAAMIFGFTAIVAILFMIPQGGDEGPDPIESLFVSLQKAPLSVVGSLQNTSVETLLQRAQKQGLKVEGVGASIEAIAAANERDPFEVMEILFMEAS